MKIRQLGRFIGAMMLALLASLALAPAPGMATTYTNPFTFDTSGYVDLGTGPLQVTLASNNAAWIIASDTQPSASATGEVLNTSVPHPMNVATHVWGRAINGSATVQVTQTIAGGSGGTVTDTQSMPFQGAVAMTVGTTYAAQRSVGVLATAAGNVAMTLADASVITLPVFIGWQTFPFAATAINTSGTTATATYYNLK